MIGNAEKRLIFSMNLAEKGGGNGWTGVDLENRIGDDFFDIDFYFDGRLVGGR
jgi:hypothetical protein